jgi:hypothetical protein
MATRSYILAKGPANPDDSRDLIVIAPGNSRRVIVTVPESCAVDVRDALQAAYENGRADQAAEQARPVTRVMFRKFRDSGDIIAVFPDLPGDSNPATCASYMHTGQHGSADLLEVVYNLTYPARPEEFAALRRELESPPYEYRFEVVRRTPPDSADLRRKALRHE